MAVTHYEKLGVSKDAVPDAIRKAYRRRAMLFHPDRHRGSPPEVVADAEHEMTALNDAYAVLGDAEQRAAYDAALGNGRDAHLSSAPFSSEPFTSGPGAPRARRRGRAPGPSECRICGSCGAVAASFRSETGRIFGRTRQGIDGPFCRSCGESSFRYMTDRTLFTG